MSPSFPQTGALKWVVFTLLVLVALLVIGLNRVRIDTDIVSTLPVDDAVISDARSVLAHHPMRDQIAIQISQPHDDPDRLVKAAERVARGLQQSGLFEPLGPAGMADLIPELVQQVVTHLPVLFSAEELERRVAPLLNAEYVGHRLATHLERLQQLEGIGQARWIAADPLELRNLVLARLAALAPSRQARVHRGQILSADGRHLLILAKPLASGTDTHFARKAAALMDQLALTLNQAPSPTDAPPFQLTAVGAFRAALDNEEMARADSRRALVFSTLGIALLLLLAFPRSWMGLLSLLPAVTGTVAAFFIYALWHPAVSVLTLGFGGAIVSITVDHGIAYMLFLDRPEASSGRQAAREIWAVGLIATLTTVGAFLALSLSGFPVLAEIGRFAALGIAGAFGFIHTVLPRILPGLPAARRQPPLPLARGVDSLALSGGRAKLWIAVILAAALLPFARPDFQVDLRRMNTISDSTRAAEEAVTGVWGNLFSRVFLLTEADSLEHLRARSDALLPILEKKRREGVFAAAFVPAMLFPGETAARQHFAAWQRFWTPERTAAVRALVAESASSLGFAPAAFDAFWGQIQQPTFRLAGIPPAFFDLLGISRNPADGTWRQFSTLAPGPAYRPASFYAAMASHPGVRLFDPQYFADTLGGYLAETFQRMVWVIGASVVVLLFVFFLDWQLTLAALLPLAFAFIATLATLAFLGHPLDIPGLMLSIIVLGMGVDYALFFVRAHQRYLNGSAPDFSRVRMAVFLASASTLIGFGVLMTADHALLKSAGLTTFLGIFYALAGAFLILPPLLERLFQPQGPKGTSPADVYRCFRHLTVGTRLRARLRLAVDPVFNLLAHHLPSAGIAVEMGAGCGVRAAWMRARFPALQYHGVEPDPANARVASRMTSPDGGVQAGPLTCLPATAEPIDAVLLIDVLPFLPQGGLTAILSELTRRLRPGGRLILRSRVAAENRPSGWRPWLLTRLEHHRGRRLGRKPTFLERPLLEARLRQAGFDLKAEGPTPGAPDVFWWVAVFSPESAPCEDTSTTS